MFFFCVTATPQTPVPAGETVIILVRKKLLFVQKGDMLLFYAQK